MKEYCYQSPVHNFLIEKNLLKKINIPFLILSGLLFVFTMPKYSDILAQDVTITYDPGPSGTYVGETLGGGIDGQSFTATKTGFIKSISVFAWMLDDATIKIYSGEGTGGTLLHSQTFPRQNAGQVLDGNRYIEASVNFTSSVSITSGSRYTFTFEPINTISMAYTDNNGYADGFLFRDGAIPDVIYDLAFKVVQGDTPFPVELTKFTAGFKGSSVIINWQTATEVNNYGFEIERSAGNRQLPIDNKDYSEWQKIGFIPGNGISNSPKDYSFIDENPPAGKIRYRLKQIDTDGGSAYYSNISEVNYNLTGANDGTNSGALAPADFALAQNYPNPFNPSTRIRYSIPGPEKVLIKVYDVLGKEVSTLLDEYKNAGTYEIEFDADNLTSGLYFYKIISGNFSETRKMILMR